MNKLSEENWISIKETKPNVQLCMNNHSTYCISNPIRIKTKTGCDFIAKYKILLTEYNSIYLGKESWKICGLDFEITSNEVESWMELPDKYEGEMNYECRILCM